MEMLIYFKSVSQAMLQIVFLGLIGFTLVYKKVVSTEGISGLTSFLIEVTFPTLVFWQIITKFSFSAYPKWWVFSLLSLLVTAFGLFTGYIFSSSIKEAQVRREFICLTGFQNSGYLPLSLLGWIIPKGQLAEVLIYLFLFLLGFNLVIWSWGVYFLSDHKLKSFSFASLFSPPVIATLLGFVFVIFKINTLLPKFILSPLEMLGNCSFPLAIVMVGASLAELCLVRNGGSKEPGSGISCRKGLFYERLVFRAVLLKLMLMPLAGLLLVTYLKLPYYIGLLVVLELAMPSAANLVIIVRKYGSGEKLVSQGVFFSHITCLITLPLLLALFNWVVFWR